MPEPLVMPNIGESVTQGIVLRWLKAEGDRVEREGRFSRRFLAVVVSRLSERPEYR